MLTRTYRGAFDFFTYGELLWWFFFTLVINPFRWKWVLFVIFGVGSALPLKVVEHEDRLRDGLENINGNGKKVHKARN